MITFPNAKINIGLNVLDKREDDYHNIESLLFPIPLYDSLEIAPSKEFSFHQYGKEIKTTLSKNLILKAYQLLKDKFNLDPVEIHLIKNIPVGAGLGGGSSNAAFTLKMCDELFELNLKQEELMKYALELGSDCPFFIENKPQLASGRGEILESHSIHLSGKFLLLATPEFQQSTLVAFQKLKLKNDHKPLIKSISSPIENWNSIIKNDFQESFFGDHPNLYQDFKKIQSESIYASLSGTGSAFYGIFNEKKEIKVNTKHIWLKL